MQASELIQEFGISESTAIFLESKGKIPLPKEFPTTTPLEDMVQLFSAVLGKSDQETLFYLSISTGVVRGTMAIRSDESDRLDAEAGRKGVRCGEGWMSQGEDCHAGEAKAGKTKKQRPQLSEQVAGFTAIPARDGYPARKPTIPSDLAFFATKSQLQARAEELGLVHPKSASKNDLARSIFDKEKDNDFIRDREISGKLQQEFKRIDEMERNEKGWMLLPYEKEKMKQQLVVQALQHKVLPYTKEQKDHGMAEYEEMHELSYQGVNYYSFEKFTPESHLARLLAGMTDLKVPDTLTRATRDVYISSQNNKDDSYWAQNSPTLKAMTLGGLLSIGTNATGGNGSVCFYKQSLGNDAPGLAKTLVHEMGHNLAYRKYSNTTPPADSDFFAATKSGEPVTGYAGERMEEDFAESVAYYIVDPKRLQEASSTRYQVIKRLMEDPNYGG